MPLKWAMDLRAESRSGTSHEAVTGLRPDSAARAAGSMSVSYTTLSQQVLGGSEGRVSVSLDQNVPGTSDRPLPGARKVGGVVSVFQHMHLYGGDVASWPAQRP
jgi:hypothetical protein